MANLPLFKQMQYDFAAHIRNPALNQKPAAIEARRMKIYSDLFYNNVEDFIANTYPVLKSITAESDWHEMIRDYFSNHLSHTPLFPEMPREFLKYIETERNNANDPAFIKELAHYEWIELALMTSDLDQDINWDTIDTDGDLLNSQPVMSPLAWPLTYQYPVQNICSNFVPESPSAEATYLLIYRDLNDKVHFMELNPVTALLIQFINEKNNFTTKEILEKIASQLNHPEPDVVIQGGHQIIQDLKNRNVILGVNNKSNL
ncbi:MAG: putative DNA-binding domain-containing protein [Gammaproteobacteria bacterium]|nr:putative DNA-binding domain-containing protein [Gammaproteobacteria bacterium]MCW8987181.1 putative DNA-binding domain-containing protein [Gammaproteobacteria bacterium]